MSGQIIFLNGPSSCGKSTTARALQDVVELPFWHISIDHLRDSGVLPLARIDRKDFLWSDMRTPFFDGFHASLAAYAHAGNNLILEHILDTAEWFPHLKTLLAPFDVVFVGIHCDLGELRRRELARGNRRVGSAEEDVDTVHKGRVYDIEIDGRHSARRNAELILECRRSGLRKSEFANTGRS
ncbi:MAG: AAA family ATPase [Pseudomonadota bacterium]